MQIPSPNADFKTKTGVNFPGFPSKALAEMHQALADELKLPQDVVAEAASYSMAMVVRFALGLSAQGGKVCGIVKDSLAGYVALATIRHLVNAGAEAQVLLLLDEGKASPELERQVYTLEKLGVKIPDPDAAEQMDGFTQFLKDAHNIIFGVYKPNYQPDEFTMGICELLNEERTPVHCIEAPPGLNVETGEASANALYASSTLSLGAPLKGLNPGKNYVGRHYLCDISFSHAIYQKHGGDLSGFFSDQPVIQIYPLTTDEV